MLVGYVRISSTSDDRQSTDLQRDALLSAGVDERNIHEDKASGARDDRPGFKVCLEFLRAGDVLIGWKLDRLGRSLPHLIEIVGGLRARGVGFRSLTESIDTTTAMGKFVFHVFGVLAQYERSLIKERVRAGLEAARRRGRVGGRPRRLDAERIAAARSLLADNMTLSTVARSVGVPRSTLVDSLRRSPPNRSDAKSDGIIEGLRYAIDRRGVNEWEVVGIQQSMIDKFSKRTAQIGAEAERLGIVDAASKAKLGAMTRCAKQKDWTMPELPLDGDGLVV